MRILVVSDTHGRHGMFEMALEKAGQVDCLFHLGDIEGEEDYFEIDCPFPVYMVGGNNDFYSDLLFEREVTVGGKKIFMAHGHTRQVHAGTRRIVEEASRRGADIVMYGHTHVPYLEKEEGILVMNPGSLTYPRQRGCRPSYILMEIGENGAIQAEIYYL